MKKNNSGFSLIELVVAIAVLSIVSTAIFQFMIVSSKHYQKQTREVELQFEAQLAMNQLQDLVIDAAKGISYSVNGSAGKILKDDEITVSSVTSKQITAYHTDKYYIVKWDAATQRLLYSEYRREADNSWTKIAGDVLMAEYVKSFSADLSETEKSGNIRFDVVFNNEREYKVTQNVTLRNRVRVNASLSDMYS